MYRYCHNNKHNNNCLYNYNIIYLYNYNIIYLYKWLTQYEESQTIYVAYTISTQESSLSKANASDSRVLNHYDPNVYQ